MKDNSEHCKQMTLSILRSHPEGLTINTLAEIIGMHRQTITKYIFELRGSGKIYSRSVGSAKLCYIKDNRKGEIL